MNRKLFICLLVFLCRNCFSQVSVEWNYVSDLNSDELEILSSNVPNDLVQTIYLETGLALHNEIIDDSGEFINRYSYNFPDTFKLDIIDGIKIDSLQGVYVWGQAKKDILFYQNFLLHFNAEMQIDWLQYFDDSLRLHPYSFLKSGDTIHFITSSTNVFLIWKYVNGFLEDTCIFFHENAGGLTGTTISYSGLNPANNEIFISNETYDSLLIYQITEDCAHTFHYLNDLPPDFISSGIPGTRLLYPGSNRKIYSLHRSDEELISSHLIICLNSEDSVLWSHEFDLDASYYLRNKLYLKNDFEFLDIILMLDESRYKLCVLNLTNEGEILFSDTLDLNNYFDVGNTPDFVWDSATNRIVIYISDIEAAGKSGLLYFDLNDFSVDTLILDYSSTIMAETGTIHLSPDDFIYLVNSNKDIPGTEALEITKIGGLPDAIFESTIHEYQINVSPNPVHSELFIDPSISGNFTYYIYDVVGRRQKSGLLNTNIINLEFLPPGIYSILLTDQKTIFSCRFVKL